MRTLADWQSINSFEQPDVRIIKRATILGYIKAIFGRFKIPWHMDIFNYHCQTWSHGRHLIGSSIALFSKALTISIVYACTLSKMLSVLMCCLKLGAAFYIWDCSGMHLMPAVWLAPCKLWRFSMLATRFRKPQMLIAACVSSGNLRRHYKSQFEVSCHL
jgi:hypothetical protein